MQTRSRWTGGIIVIIAVVMLLVGQTVLKPYLRGLIYVGYWLVCIVFTFLALIFAFLDLRRVRDQTRDQQRELIERTLEGLPEAARRKHNRSASDSSEGS